MENLFDVINNRMFSVFSSKDKRANYDLLSTIYDVFTKDERKQAVFKEDLIDKLTSYIKGCDFDEFDDDEGTNIANKSSRDKASAKLRQFKKCGWVEEDNSEGFDIVVSLTDTAIALLETFKTMISKRERPLEYTGYFYIIYEALRNFEYSKSKAWIEQIVKNTTELFNSLQGLHSEIKLYISKLVKRKDLTPHDVLDLLLNKYQDQVILTVFNNLKGRDNPSKYTSEILSKLKSIRYDHLDDVVTNYALTANIKDLTAEIYEELEKNLKDDLDTVILRFESVNDFISVIDRKNRKFHSSALATLNFLMNNRNDIEGQVDKALKALKSVDAEDYSEIIDIHSCRNIDEHSLYSRAFNKEKKTQLPTQIPEILEDEVAANFDAIFGADEFSKSKINEFVLCLFGNKERIAINEIPIKSEEDFLKLVLIQIYSQYEEMIYQIKYYDDIELIFGYSMQTFDIIRRKSL